MHSMIFENLHGLSIPKIGFGCWAIGGEMRADHSQDARSLRALRSALELGYTHFDTAEMYAAGLIAQPRVIAIPASQDRDHIRENLTTAEIELSAAEMEHLEKYA